MRFSFRFVLSRFVGRGKPAVAYADSRLLLHMRSPGQTYSSAAAARFVGTDSADNALTQCACFVLQIPQTTLRRALHHFLSESVFIASFFERNVLLHLFPDLTTQFTVLMNDLFQHRR